MLSHVQLCDPMDCSPPGSSVHGDSPGKNTGVGSHILLQEIFPTQGSNPGLPHCRVILYHLSHQGSPHPPAVVVQSLSRVRLFTIPWTADREARLLCPLLSSQSLLKLMSIESVMPSSYLILCRPLLFLPPIPPSLRVFSNRMLLFFPLPLVKKPS